MYPNLEDNTIPYKLGVKGFPGLAFSPLLVVFPPNPQHVRLSNFLRKISLILFLISLFSIWLHSNLDTVVHHSVPHNFVIDNVFDVVARSHSLTAVVVAAVLSKDFLLCRHTRVINKSHHMLFGQRFVWVADCYAILFILS